MTDSSARWRALEELFQSAVEREPAARAAFLDEACPDIALRREVESMLDAHPAGDELLGRPALNYVFQAIEPGSMLGPYRIEERIGTGGMGDVYRAMDLRLQRAIAIKTLPAVYARDSEWLARFQSEARVLASLNHPRIAAIYGLEESGGLALAMELVEGPTLAGRIACGALPLADALAIARQIAEALEYAHEKGVIHCDLKPANIKISMEGTVKVLDFGLARAAGESVATRSAAREGEIFGTPAYMAPEQASGMPLDRRTDIWSFGVVLFEMLSGRRMFAQSTSAAVVVAVVREEPHWRDLPAETPVAIHELLKRCLDKDPKQRLRDIGEARIAIERAQSGEAAGPARAAAASQGKGWMLVAMALSILVCALVAWALTSGWFRSRPIPLGAAQLQLAFPEGTGSWPDPYSPNSVPSPDGKRIAFIAVSQGRNYLWVQAFDSTTAQRIDNTEGAFFPIWAPDGKSIAFFAGGKLKRISVAGGTPWVLCSAGGYGGGAWSSVGVILFSEGAMGLMRVAEAGGDPTPVTRADPLLGERDHGWPQFLPDGKHFLYIAYDGGSTGSIYVQELGSIQRTLVLKTPWRAVYASGRLLFVRHHALIAQPFDLKSFQLYGDAVPLVPHVNAQPGGFTTPVAASENGVLAYRGDDAPPLLTWHGRDGKPLGIVGFAADFSGPALSPDETWLAVAVRHPATEKRDIWLFNLLRGDASQITTDPADDMNPTWSPDGRRIAFTSDRRGQRETYMKDPFGTASEELISTETNGGENVDDWSPDGRWIAYETFPGKQHISLLYLETGKTQPYTFAGEHRARFSPDGKWVAYQSNDSGEVSIQPLPATGAKWQISVGGGFQPQWRGDGKELFYASGARPTKIMAVDIAVKNGVIQAGIPHALFSVQMTLDGRNGWVVTRDGKKFLVIVPQKQKAAAAILPVIFNWPALLEKR
jgi:eukaryotic-like serine/threonine-protein kinase